MKKKSRANRKSRDSVSKLRLGPGGVVYVVVTGLILGAAIYTQANLLFWAFGLMIGGLAISLLMAWQTLRAVRVQRLLPGHGVCGEPLVLRYHITNRSWLPVFGLMIQETWGKRGRSWKRVGPIAESPPRLKGRPHGWVLHLGPHQAIQADAICWPLRRGPLRFEKIVLSTSFPFGVVRKVVEFQQSAQVLVYPQLHRMNRRVLYTLSNLDPSGRKQVERAGGNEEFFGIRPYRYGDSLKLIDWKHTARTGDLVAREMTRPSPPRVMILLDLNAASGVTPVHPQQPRKPRLGRSDRTHAPDGHLARSNEEKAISLAASLVCDAHFHGYQIGLAVVGVRCPAFPVHHSLPHRTRILEALATLDLTQRGNNAERAPDRPSVVIWPGPGDTTPTGGPRGSAAILGAADMDLYVDLSHLASDVLRQRVRPVSRREELEEEAVRLKETRA